MAICLPGRASRVKRAVTSEIRSPFWDAIGRNFFDLNYAAAERLCGLKSRTFLAELMPHYPIYVPLLPAT